MSTLRTPSTRLQLEHVLCSPSLLAELKRQFLDKKDSSAPLLEFYLKVEQFKDIEETKERSLFAKELFHNYISKGTIFSKELKASIRKKLKNVYIATDIFNGAQQYALHKVMEASIVTSFLDTHNLKASDCLHYVHTNPRSSTTKTTIQELLDLPDGEFRFVEDGVEAYRLFFKFCEKEFATENIEFLHAVLNFKAALNQREREKRAKQIFVLFLQPGSIREISLKSSTLSRIAAHFGKKHKSSGFFSFSFSLSCKGKMEESTLSYDSEEFADETSSPSSSVLALSRTRSKKARVEKELFDVHMFDEAYEEVLGLLLNDLYQRFLVDLRSSLHLSSSMDSDIDDDYTVTRGCFVRTRS